MKTSKRSRTPNGKLFNGLPLRVLAVVIVLAIALVLPRLVNTNGMTKAQAAGYTYTITVSGGLHGTVNGTDKVTLTMNYGEQWNPGNYSVTVDNDKYYFKGFHVSGHEGLVGATVITQDMDFVATYGIKGQTVAYTVGYLDAEGNELAPTQTFYGNVGDKPVVAFVYIEGYQPQAYNLTKTLSENEAENVFNFIYTVIPVEEESSSGGGTEESSGGGTEESSGNESGESSGEGGESSGEESGESSEGGESSGGQGESSGDQGESSGSQGGEGGEESSESSSNPSELIDLDDSDVPQTRPEESSMDDTPAGRNKSNAIKTALIAGGSAVVLAGGVVGGILIAKNRKKKKEQGQ